MRQSPPRSQERRESAGQKILKYIYARAGRITANKGQKHLREFENDTPK
jgi:hypothetical protein